MDSKQNNFIAAIIIINFIIIIIILFINVITIITIKLIIVNFTKFINNHFIFNYQFIIIIIIILIIIMKLKVIINDSKQFLIIQLNFILINYLKYLQFQVLHSLKYSIFKKFHFFIINIAVINQVYYRCTNLLNLFLDSKFVACYNHFNL